LDPEAEGGGTHHFMRASVPKSFTSSDVQLNLSCAYGDPKHENRETDLLYTERQLGGKNEESG
jgi:hypothetical protein